MADRRMWGPFALLLVLLVYVAVDVRAADGEGAYTLKNGQAESYWPDKQTAAAYGLLDGSGSVADVSTDTDTYLVELRDPNSRSEGVRQNVPVSFRFSNSGATATVWMVFYYYDGEDYHVLGVDQPLSGGTVTTLDATAARDASGGDYIAHTYVFDSYGATHCALICTAMSAGTGSAWVGSY